MERTLTEQDARVRAGVQLVVPVIGSCFALIVAAMFIVLAPEWNQTGADNELVTPLVAGIAVAGLIANIAIAARYKLSGWRLVAVFTAWLVSLPLAAVTAVALLDLMYPPYVSPV